jgi:hypothetical protein
MVAIMSLLLSSVLILAAPEYLMIRVKGIVRKEKMKEFNPIITVITNNEADRQKDTIL